MSRFIQSSFLRQTLPQTAMKFPSIPSALSARPHLNLPHSFLHQSHNLQTIVAGNAFRSTTRSFSSNPFRSDFSTENRFSSSQDKTRAWSWRKTCLGNKEHGQSFSRGNGAERARNTEARLNPLKSRLYRYLLPLYRLRFRFSHRRSSTWRPAHLNFRTSNFSGVFTRSPRTRRCAQDASRHLKLCRRFPLAYFDERRRHEPQRAGHFRYCINLVRQEVALHFSQGSRAWKDGLQMKGHHHRWCPKKKFMEQVEEELKSGGGRAGTRMSHFERCHRVGRCRDNGGRDYETFRRAYWYSKTHAVSRPYNRTTRTTATRTTNRFDSSSNSSSKTTGSSRWKLGKPYEVGRKRAGLAFFTLEESPSARKVQGVEGRGGDGGIRRRYVDTKIQFVELRSPSFRPSIRPQLSIPIPAPVSLFSRAFSSTRPRSGIHFLVPLATALKSTEALHVLVWVTRLSLTLLPLSVRSKAIFLLRQRYLRDPSSLTASVFSRLASQYYSSSLAQPSGLFARFNAFFGLPLLLLSPFLLLGLVAVASLERTPVTGRWRFVMLSPSEESELVESILSVGRVVQSATTSTVHNGETVPVAPEGTSLDWVAILRQVLDLPDEGVDPETGRRMLLGGVVLDQRDWRVRWTEAVLRALEKGVVEGVTRGGAGAKGEGEALKPPPMKYLLEGRAAARESTWKDELVVSKHLTENEDGKQLQVEYDILVIDRDENNAFSFGFSPEAQTVEDKGRRGVIVVYTGFLKEVLGDTALPSPPPKQSSPPTNSSRLSFFSRSSTPSQPLSDELDPIASYLVPSTLPTQEQCKSLAVLLSHETSHLILSHTLESYASMNLLMPHLARLASDVVRTLLYPVTMILGPFINDALGKSFNEGAQAGFGFWGHAANSCESRKLESEADLVALRLLAGSGIDPRFALDFWENRLAAPSTSASSTNLAFSPNPSVHHHSKNSNDGSSPVGMLDGYMRTHPVDRERLEKIRDELKSWEEWNRSLVA
ncbi:uncharacterized protein JCM6883_003640 [Sporobolomyces salmoneus]|uniref:uncharacterized protein n=1 Tax=Sporobolomyces salmoneus TaxID=183962 RepID=UPI003171E86B